MLATLLTYDSYLEHDSALHPSCLAPPTLGLFCLTPEAHAISFRYTEYGDLYTHQSSFYIMYRWGSFFFVCDEIWPGDELARGLGWKVLGETHQSSYAPHPPRDATLQKSRQKKDNLPHNYHM